MYQKRVNYVSRMGQAAAALKRGSFYRLILEGRANWNMSFKSDAGHNQN
jgi:hypothetical protein